MDKVAHFGITG